MKLRFNNKCLLFMLVILVTAVVVYWFCYLTPLYADDYCYSFIFGTDGQRVKNLQDIIKSQVYHYNHVNGRVLLHFFVQLFLLVGKSTYNMIASIGFIVLGLLICYHGMGSIKEMTPLSLLISYASLFLFVPKFGQSFLWLTGSVNYLFGILIVLLFLIPYRRQMPDSKNHILSRKKKMGCGLRGLCAIGMCLFGFISGATNENTAFSLIACLIAYFLWRYFSKKEKPKLWMLTGLLGAIGGFLFMCLAPGELGRLSTSSTATGNIIVSMMKSLILYSIDMFDYCGILILIISVMIVFLWNKNIKNSNKNFKLAINDSCSVWFYILFFFCSVYSMVIPGTFPDRVWSGPTCVLTVILINTAKRVVSDDSILGVKFNPKAITTCLFIGIFMVYSGICGNAYFDLKQVHIAYTDRLETITEYKESASDNGKLRLSPIRSSSKFSCFRYSGDLSANPQNWVNTYMAKYYEVDEIYSVDGSGAE